MEAGILYLLLMAEFAVIGYVLYRVYEKGK